MSNEISKHQQDLENAIHGNYMLTQALSPERRQKILGQDKQSQFLHDWIAAVNKEKVEAGLAV